MRVAARGRVVAAVAGVLVAVAPAPVHAQGQTGTADINPDHVPTTASTFGQPDCSGEFADLTSDEDGWHFVLPAASGDNFEILTLTYDSPGGEVTVVIESRDPDNPSTGPGWSGYLDATGAGDFRHANVVTDAGWTLTGGTAVVDSDEGGNFNLSHTCPGYPVATPTPTPSPSPSATPGPTPPPTPTPSPSLPVTGGSTGSLVLLGVGILGAGLLALGLAGWSARRRLDRRR